MSPKTRDKGKAKVVEVVDVKIQKKRVSDEEAMTFMKVLKASEYTTIERMSKFHTFLYYCFYSIRSPIVKS